MAASNVIPFKRKSEPVIQSHDYSDEDILIDDILTEIIYILYDEGYDFFEKEEEYGCELSLLFESLRCLLNKYNDEYHCFQDVAKNLFLSLYEDEDKQLTFDF
jgi:hypothetical protein